MDSVGTKLWLVNVTVSEESLSVWGFSHPGFSLRLSIFLSQSSSTVEIILFFFFLKPSFCYHVSLWRSQVSTCVTCYVLILWFYVSGLWWRPVSLKAFLRIAQNPPLAKKHQEKEEQRLLIGSQRLPWLYLALETKDKCNLFYCLHVLQDK